MTDLAEQQTEQTEVTADALAERLFMSTLGAMEILSVYVGDRLGWYKSLAADGSATYTELAERTSTHPRYAQEWLEGQAVLGIVTTDASQSAASRRYQLPAAAAEVFTHETSLAYLAPVGRAVAAIGRQLPNLLDAYRGGGGVSWEQLGDDMRGAQAAFNRPWFEHQLGEALGGVPEVHDLLSRSGAK
ncbi:MAG: SAM-dependent methyltransferase, partial [Nocardioidaceae bacterium]